MRLVIASLCCLLLPVLAHANGYESYPAPLVWSPDSQLLAVAYSPTWPYDDGTVQGTLRLFDREGQPVSELASGKVGSPAFAPDSLKLIAVVDGKLAEWDMYTDLPVLFYETPTPVLDCCWAPGSEAGDELGICMSIGERFYGADIWHMDVSGNKLERITSLVPPPDPELEAAIAEADKLTPIEESRYHPSYDSAVAPLVSADGRRLWFLFQASASGASVYERLYLLDLATAALRQATQPADPASYPWDYHESNPVELSDHEMLFQRGGWGDWKLIHLDLDSGAETVELPDAEQPSLSADGRWLGFTRRPADQKARMEYDWEVLPQVWLADRETGKQWRVPQSIAGGEFPAVSPDGTLLAWLEFDRGAVQVRVASTAELTSEPPTVVIKTHATIKVATNEDANTTETGCEADMDQFNVVLDTTKGNIVLAVHPEWAPRGAAHFRELVEAGFYDGAPWFRVIGGFVAQIGIAADPALNAQWGEKTIADEPVVQGNKPGFVAYGQSAAPNSRSTHFFINYADNSRLDGMGFACFAEVVEGMDAARSLAKVEYDDQGGLAMAGGLDKFKRRFPNADYVTRAYVRK